MLILLLEHILEVYLFNLIEITVIGNNNLPKESPALIAIAPHHNQLIDPLAVQAAENKKIHFVAAAVTYKRKFVGLFARLMGSIPVERAQDHKIKINGKITVKNNTIDVILMY